MIKINRNIANGLDFLMRNTNITVTKLNKITTEILSNPIFPNFLALSINNFDVHPINWAREEPKSMSQAGNEVGYAVFNRLTSEYTNVNLSPPKNVTLTA